MLSITYFLVLLLEMMQSKGFLLCVNTLSCLLKLYILHKLIVFGIKKYTELKKTFYLLLVVLICYMLEDVTWIVHLSRVLWFPHADYRPYLFIIRLTWGFCILRYQAFSLFIETILHARQYYSFRQKLLITISSAFFIFDFLLACINFNCLESSARPLLEFYVRTAESYYGMFLVLLPTILYAIYRIRTTNLPRILKKQVKILVSTIIIPMWCSDFLQLFPLTFYSGLATNSYASVGISTILLTFAVYYAATRVIAFRFLNLSNHVHSIANFNFIDGFKDVLEQLSHASSYSELGHITQTFFKQNFTLPLHKTSLYVRKSESHDSTAEPVIANKTVILIEGFLSQHTQDMCDKLQELKILIHDEIEFNCFHDNNKQNIELLHFLDIINADVFLPIYEKNSLIAYIIVDRYAQPHAFYGDTQRDEMLVFSSYLGNIINLLQSRNLKLLLHQEKVLKKELYQKHQEIAQYKESIHSFLRTNEHKDIGILFYKRSQFIFGNKAAKELINVNINTQKGHPIAKALQAIGKQVEEFKSATTCTISDGNSGKLILAGVPNLEQNNIIITVYKPEISDLIKQQINCLKDPTQWDYLLYLETTKSGKLINQLIPGTGQTLLDFKLHLLKLALSSKAILLHMPEQDLMPTVEIIHHISLRERLHAIKLKAPHQNQEVAVQIFGINPLFGIKERSLLEQLDTSGTLFIQNIDLLDFETQKDLAEFLKYGLYKIFKSDQRLTSNARIICSTHKDLKILVHEGLFSQELYNELNEASLSLPSLLTLSSDELENLADGLTEQVLQTTDFNMFLELTSQDKLRLTTKRAVSLTELKNKIESLLIKKSKDHNIYTEAQFDPAYQLSDPQLIEAARLGRNALRDPHLVTMLWNKFKNQSKIALFLGVNRSSVNRRCKDLNLI